MFAASDKLSETTNKGFALCSCAVTVAVLAAGEDMGLGVIDNTVGLVAFDVFVAILDGGERKDDD